MSILIKNGAYVLNEQGGLMEAKGLEEILNRAMIRLKARRGRFALDPGLGSELYQLNLAQTDDARLEALIREALAPIRGLTLTGLSHSKDGDGGLRLQIRLRYLQQEALLELGGFSLEEEEGMHFEPV